MEQRTGLELRADSGAITGVAIRYAEIAERTPHGRREQFLRGAFQPLGAATVNIEHDREAPPLAWTSGGGLELIDSSDALAIRAELQGDAGRAAYDAVTSGQYSGLSIEFAALKEDIDVFRNLRTLARAVFHGVALTSAPIYQQTSIEARALRIEERAGGLMLAGTLPHGASSRIVTADRGRVRKAEYGRDTWEHTVNSELGKLAEVSLTLHRDLTQQIASRRAGSLRLKNDANGLHFEANLPARGESARVDELITSIENAQVDWQLYPVIQVPPTLRVPRPFIDIPEEPGSAVFVRKFLDVSLRQLSLVAKSGSPASKIRIAT